MNFVNRVATGTGLALLAGSSFAVDPTTLAELTSSISFTSAATAMLSIGASIVAFKIVKQGVVIVMSMIGKAR